MKSPKPKRERVILAMRRCSTEFHSAGEWIRRSTLKNARGIELRDAFVDAIGPAFNSISLGYWFKAHSGSTCGELVLRGKHSAHRKSWLWKVHDPEHVARVEAQKQATAEAKAREAAELKARRDAIEARDAALGEQAERDILAMVEARKEGRPLPKSLYRAAPRVTVDTEDRPAADPHAPPAEPLPALPDAAAAPGVRNPEARRLAPRTPSYLRRGESEPPRRVPHKFHPAADAAADLAHELEQPGARSRSWNVFDT